MTTTTERPEVRSLPRLDVEAAARRAPQLVAEALAGATTAEARAAAAARLLESVTRKADQVRAARDAAAYTLATHYHVRRGASIPGALGVGRTRWMVIRKEQADLAPDPVPDAPTRLPRLAYQAALLAEQVNAATAARDAAILELVAAGWSNARVARLVNRDPARIAHVRKDHQRAREVARSA